MRGKRTRKGFGRWRRLARRWIGGSAIGLMRSYRSRKRRPGKAPGPTVKIGLGLLLCLTLLPIGDRLREIGRSPTWPVPFFALLMAVSGWVQIKSLLGQFQ